MQCNISSHSILCSTWRRAKSLLALQYLPSSFCCSFCLSTLILSPLCYSLTHSFISGTLFSLPFSFISCCQDWRMQFELGNWKILGVSVFASLSCQVLGNKGAPGRTSAWGISECWHRPLSHCDSNSLVTYTTHHRWNQRVKETLQIQPRPINHIQFVSIYWQRFHIVFLTWSASSRRSTVTPTLYLSLFRNRRNHWNVSLPRQSQC